VKLAKLRRRKAPCSPLYADCRPKTDAVILWDMGHTKRRLCMGGIGPQKENKNLNVVDMIIVQE
jgi:hypothetical protein